MKKRRKGFYSISVVAKMFSVHQQTIRLYEKEGLISPKRSSGNTRLFSEEDVDQLEEIIHLTHKMGVNLIGVELILKQQKKIQKLQNEINKLFGQTQELIEKETEEYKEDAKKQVARLSEIKQKNAKKGKGNSQPIDIIQKTIDDNDENDEKNEEDWEIDYEE